MENRWINIIDTNGVEYLIDLEDISRFEWTGDKFITPVPKSRDSYDKIEFTTISRAERIFNELKDMLQVRTFQ